MIGIIIFPFLGVLVYLDRAWQQDEQARRGGRGRCDEAFRSYVQQAAGSSGGGASTADELEKLARLATRECSAKTSTSRPRRRPWPEKGSFEMMMRPGRRMGRRGPWGRSPQLRSWRARQRLSAATCEASRRRRHRSRPTPRRSSRLQRPRRRHLHPAAAPAAAGGDDLVSKLNELAQLKAQGILSEAEFEAAKAKLLG